MKIERNLIYIYWRDLTEESQKELLELFGISFERDMNWAVFPIAALMVEKPISNLPKVSKQIKDSDLMIRVPAKRFGVNDIPNREGLIIGDCVRLIGAKLIGYITHMSDDETKISVGFSDGSELHFEPIEHFGRAKR